MTISPEYAEELGRQIDELEAENERLREAMEELRRDAKKLARELQQGLPKRNAAEQLEAMSAAADRAFAAKPLAAPVEKWLEDPRVKEALHRRPPAAPVETVSFFSQNVDAWGAAEWFDRMAKALRQQYAAVVAGDMMTMETCRNVAESSAMRLVREFEQEVRAALAPQSCSAGIRDIKGYPNTDERRKWIDFVFTHWNEADTPIAERLEEAVDALAWARVAPAAQPPAAPVETETRFHTNEDREYARGLLEDMDDEQSNAVDSRINIAAQWFCKARVETARRVAKQHTQSSGNVEAPTDAVINLVNHQEQCDEDGVMVKVSRQALTEVLVYVQLVRPESASREDALEAQGTIEQLEKQLAFERKKSEPNFLHAGSPLWRIDLLCEQHELYTKDELVGLIQKMVQEAGRPKEDAHLRTTSPPSPHQHSTQEK